MGISNTQQSERLRGLIVQGHTVFPIATIGIILFSDVIERPEDLATLFAKHADTIWISAIFIVTSLWLQMLVKALDHQIFRWVVFSITAFFTGFALLHSVGDITELVTNGINMHLPFFLVFYTVGIWTTLLCWKWARLDLQG